MRSDWLKAFWPKPQEQDFFQILDLYKNKANNLVKIETNFFKLKKTIFFQFPQFLEQKGFSAKSGCHAQLHKGF